MFELQRGGSPEDDPQTSSWEAASMGSPGNLYQRKTGRKLKQHLKVIGAGALECLGSLDPRNQAREGKFSRKCTVGCEEVR